MLPWSTLYLFVTTGLILVILPGPNTLFIVARSVQQGRMAGFCSSLGVQTGTLVHITAAALGLSALLLSSALAFGIVRYAGAVYLIYLGIKTLLSKEKVIAAPSAAERKLSRAFFQGAWVQMLNPKTAVFFFAFLPQFIDPARGPVPTQIVLLGLIMVALGTFSDTVYVLGAGGLGNLLRANVRLQRVQRYFAGSVYIGLGAATALSGSHSK